ncbi:glycosyltransferase family 2 protein [Dawidia soli]|uniref:Glycosyltransferase n=1 Tax=Dawidia soli TaxID=2782352 RepID=A0AAP2DGK0_9BACT|nr:glycosyltransferase [Dawidia soli]MBT1690701.1 glycosyltransferase [Dawidia soli]
MKKVSVIITTYNAEKTIARALHSVLRQEGMGRAFTVELIVIDDCSTDDTLEILEKFSLDIQQFYSTPANSGGPNKGRNIGLRYATGDYICFLDHDDLWLPHKIRLQLQAGEHVPIVTGSYSMTNTHTGIHTLAENLEMTRFFAPNETFLKKLSKEKMGVQNTYLGTVMIHKDLKHILFEEHFGMLDFDWTLRLFEQRASAEIAAHVATRFVDGHNLSLDVEYRKKDYYYSLMCLEGFEKRYPREVALARKRINGSRARYCYLQGNMPEARKYLRKAMPGVKETLYYITSFAGSQWVKRYFPVFG